MPNQPKTPARSVRVGAPLWDAAKARAAEQGETVTDVITRALEEYVKMASRHTALSDEARAFLARYDGIDVPDWETPADLSRMGMESMARQDAARGHDRVTTPGEIPPECKTCGKRQWPVIHSCTGVRQPPRPAEADAPPPRHALRRPPGLRRAVAAVSGLKPAPVWAGTVLESCIRDVALGRIASHSSVTDEMVAEWRRLNPGRARP